MPAFSNFTNRQNIFKFKKQQQQQKEPFDCFMKTLLKCSTSEPYRLKIILENILKNQLNRI